MTDISEAPPRAASDEQLKTRLPRRRFIHDMPDKGLFAGFALAGFILILGFKTFGIASEFIAPLAVAAMVIYGVIAYRMPVMQLRLDRLGDNFYYLGFIFTLASMSAAIVQIQGGANVEALINSFGIALFTTIVGVAGRVLFVQMRGELDEVEAAIRRDLIDTANDLRAQLGMSLADFETFHRGVLQATEESLSKTLEVSKDHAERLNQIVKLAGDRIEQTFAPSRAQIEILDRLVRDIAESVGQLSKRLDEADPAARWDESLQKFDADLQGVVGRLRVIIETLGPRRRWFWPFGRRP